ncbi:LCP family protein [Nocardioides guangzhouensis]|uniref:LCP family protein n=1 Tax=Nocardioides guangzhouensis TaxID=2497878 RepID=UPI0014384F11|nr:LCP family protein [Nocardioides guangzhouensis]
MAHATQDARAEEQGRTGEQVRTEERRRSGFVRRHKAMVIMVVLLLTLLAAVGGWALYLNAQVGHISRFEVDLDRPDRPSRPAGEATTFLLVGVDAAQAGGSFENTMKQSSWPIGSYRSDAIMVLRLSADRTRATVVSIPRDSYVPVDGYGRTKINAAFSYGGPELLARTVEDATGLYLDHVAVIDFAGFEEATRVVDGVPVTLSRDEKLDGADYRAGQHELEGGAALAYVRARKSLPRGDFDRVQRQQNFIRGFLDRVGELGPGDPLTGTRLAQQLSKLVAVDADLTNGAIRSLAWDLRGFTSGGVDYYTVPTNGTAMVHGASIVRLDKEATRGMFTALGKGSIDRWVDRHDVERLPRRDAVS